MSEEVRLLEIIAQKDAPNRLLQAENERQSQEVKLLKEKIDLLIRRLFGSKSEKLDAAQLELLHRDLRANFSPSGRVSACRAVSAL